MHRAPIALFAYKRPDHISRCLASLAMCRGFYESDVHIFVDGPRSRADAQGVAEVREIVERFEHPRKYVVTQDKNRGLARSISYEVSRLIGIYGTLIIFEDDLVVHPSILDWFNSGLETFADCDRVMQIGGYQYNVPEFRGLRHGTFQRFVTTWGWATWERAWKEYDDEVHGWNEIVSDPERLRSFNMDGTYPYYRMVEKLQKGEIDSWGIRWYLSVFQANGISLMPPQTLVRNEGFAANATHNSIGFLKAFVSGKQCAMWSEAASPNVPTSVELIQSEEQAFRRGLLRTNALRNDRIKQALAALGLSRFK